MNSASYLDFFLSTSAIDCLGHPLLSQRYYDSDNSTIELHIKIPAKISDARETTFHDWQNMDNPRFRNRIKQFVLDHPIPLHRNMNLEEIDNMADAIILHLNDATESCVKKKKFGGTKPVKLQQVTVQALDMKQEWVKKRAKIDRKMSMGIVSHSAIDERNRLNSLINRVSTLISRQVRNAKNEDFMSRVERIKTGN